MLKLLCSVLLMCLATPTYALVLDTPLQNPEQEARAKALFREIRCVVCQSESIADSPAAIAKDLRMEIRSQITQGHADDVIINSLTTRYGDAILMQPPLNPNTLALWLAPLALLLIGLVVLANYFRAKRTV